MSRFLVAKVSKAAVKIPTTDSTLPTPDYNKMQPPELPHRLRDMKNLSTVVTAQKSPSLLFCIVMDLIGYATYAVPVLGELGDLVWAPISALIFFKTFGGWKGAFGGIFNFIEEILPGLDFIPTFTLTWIWQSMGKASKKMNTTTLYEVQTVR